MQSLKVFKFGGSCFKSEESFKQSLKIVEHYQENNLIIVCSALFGITNKLIEFAQKSIDIDNHKKSEEILLGIQEQHHTFINSLIRDNNLNDEMKEFIKKKLQDLRDYIPTLQNEGLTNKNLDFISSYGERMSALLYSEYLVSKGFNAKFIAADKDFIITNDDFGNALPILDITKKNIQTILLKKIKDNESESKIIFVIPGFYGTDKYGTITTLGRGGTDFTATIVGEAMSDYFNTNCIFWKDVYGILSANPKYVPEAQLLEEISIAESKELSYYGTKILHPKCLKTVETGNNITAEIRNFNDPFVGKSTIITKEPFIPDRSHQIVKAITSMEDIAIVSIESDAMVDLPGSAAKIFSILATHKININLIMQSSSENNISIGVSKKDSIIAKRILIENKYFGSHWFNVEIEDDIGLLSVVGAGMKHKPGVAGLLFTTLGNVGINIRAIVQGSSELNITMIIAKEDLSRAINVCYNSFIKGDLPKKIHTW